MVKEKGKKHMVHFHKTMDLPCPEHYVQFWSPIAEEYDRYGEGLIATNISYVNTNLLMRKDQIDEDFSHSREPVTKEG